MDSTFRSIGRASGLTCRTLYYKSVKAAPKVQPRFAEPIKAMINEEPSFGYRTVAALLGFNKNAVQRIFQLRGWQVKKRPIGFRPRVQGLPSVTTVPNQRGRRTCAVLRLAETAGWYSAGIRHWA